ncbi:MAG: hypothetical protein IPO09_04960 [Anaeromyxobacter sp.]|nr:hypothetical protein [Anaeromyxobacter sp.]
MNASSPALPLLLAAALLAGCGGAGGGSEPRPPPIDPARPGDTLYAAGLAGYGAAGQALAQAEAARAAGDLALEQSRLAEASAAFGQARATFDRVPLEFPASIRLDQAAYYGGRCSYELGLVSGQAADLMDARARLEAMIAAHPASLLLDHAQYVAGRAVFLLASGPASAADQTFTAARLHLAASLAQAPGGTYADDAQYWLGRAWFQEGFALANVVPSPLPGSLEFAAAKADLQAAGAELARVPQRFPSSPLVDNAWYYLGQSHYMEPVDTAAGKAERTALLRAAVADLSHVAGTASPFSSGARYWRGKAHYALAFVLAAGAAKDQGEVALAIADLQAVPPPSVYADNALSWLAKAFMHVEPAPTCSGTAATPPASGCSALAVLQALVAADPAYAASPYPAQAIAYLSTNGCTCP